MSQPSCKPFTFLYGIYPKPIPPLTRYEFMYSSSLYVYQAGMKIMFFFSETTLFLNCFYTSWLRLFSRIFFLPVGQYEKGVNVIKEIRVASFPNSFSQWMQTFVEYTVPLIVDFLFGWSFLHLSDWLWYHQILPQLKPFSNS